MSGFLIGIGLLWGYMTLGALIGVILHRLEQRLLERSFSAMNDGGIIIMCILWPVAFVPALMAILIDHAGLRHRRQRCSRWLEDE